MGADKVVVRSYRSAASSVTTVYPFSKITRSLKSPACVVTIGRPLRLIRTMFRAVPSISIVRLALVAGIGSVRVITGPVKSRRLCHMIYATKHALISKLRMASNTVRKLIEGDRNILLRKRLFLVSFRVFSCLSKDLSWF